MRRCDGDGVTVLARAGWLFVLGDLLATGPDVRAELQWTRCRDWVPEVAVDEDGVATPVTREVTEWWRHAGLSVGWRLAWR